MLIIMWVHYFFAVLFVKNNITLKLIFNYLLYFMLDPTSPRGVDLLCLICTCSPPYNTRHFGSSLASDSIGTLKLSEFAREHSHDGWPTGKFLCEFLETKP